MSFARKMKGINRCADCAHYNIKVHKCMICDNIETDPREPFYDDCPLPDVAPVVHGHWIDCDNGYDSYARCSECGDEFTNWEADCAHTNFCPNCGAKIDEKGAGKNV